MRFLDTLKKFYPGTELSAIQKEFGKGETISSGGAAKSYKFYVAQLRYKFPVFVTVSQNKVVDFFARLPTYFLHDIFHQSLINRYGKQDEYSKVKRNGLYIWNNENISFSKAVSKSFKEFNSSIILVRLKYCIYLFCRIFTSKGSKCEGYFCWMVTIITNK